MVSSFIEASLNARVPSPSCILVKITLTEFKTSWFILLWQNMFPNFGAHGKVIVIRGSEREGFAEDHGQAKGCACSTLAHISCIPSAEVSSLAVRVLYMIAWGSP